LASVQNTYTHSPLADIAALYSDSYELNLHVEGQTFLISFGHCLVLFIVTSLPFVSSKFQFLQAKEYTVR